MRKHGGSVQRAQRQQQGCIRRGGASEAAPEAVRQAVGGSCQWLQMPLKPALAVRGTGAGHRLGALEGGGGGGGSPPTNASLGSSERTQVALLLH